MRFSKTSEYALRILSFMINSDKQVFSARYLADHLNIPQKYLRRLMTDMAKKGFINSIQGREGGFVFGKDANSIHLAEIIDAVEGMDKYTGCLLGFSNCSDENPCSLHEAYVPIREQMLSLLNNMTVADLRNKNIKKF